AIMILFIVAIAFLLFRNILLEDHVLDEAKSDVQFFISISEGKDTMFMQILKSNPDDETEKLQEMNLDILDTLRKLQSVTATPEWREWLQLENEFISQVQNFQDEDGDYPLSKNDMDYTLILNNYLLTEDIPLEFDNYSYSYQNFLKQTIVWLFIFRYFILFFSSDGGCLGK